MPIHVNTIFSSDLSRARLTAEGICRQQPSRPNGTSLTPILSSDLREKDFGSLEGTRLDASATSGGGPVRPHGTSTSMHHMESESTGSMKRRTTNFLNFHIIPLLFEAPSSKANIVVVAHGIILRVLWNCLVELFDPMNVSMASGVASREGGPAALLVPSWSNTGYMPLLIEPQSVVSATDVSQSSHKDTPGTLLHGWSIKILAINSREHVANLRRTRGGIGSATHDTRQKRIDHFFTR